MLAPWAVVASSSSFLIAGLPAAEAGPSPCAALSRDGTIVVYRGRDRIEVRKTEPRQAAKKIRTAKCASRPYGGRIGLSDDGRLLAYEAPDGLAVEETLTGKRLSTVQLRGHGAVGTATLPAEAFAFSPNGRTLAVAYGALYHHWVVFVDLPSGAARSTALDDYDMGSRRLVWSPDGTLLAGGDPAAFVLRRDGSALLRPPQRGDVLKASPEAGVRTVIGYGPFFRKGRAYASDGTGVFVLGPNTPAREAATAPVAVLNAPDGSWAARRAADDQMEIFRPAEKAFDAAAKPAARYEAKRSSPEVGGGGRWLLLPHGADFFAIDLRP